MRERWEPRSPVAKRKDEPKEAKGGQLVFQSGSENPGQTENPPII